MSPNKPQIQTLFVTPLCVHYLPVAAEMNATLRPLIAEKAAAAPATAQGALVEEDFRLWGNHHAETLVSVITDLADGMTASRNGGRIKTDWSIAIRAIARSRGEQREMAARPHVFWAGVYFVDDGYGKSDDEAMGGQCELSDPRGPLPGMIAPNLAFRLPGGQGGGFSEMIRPQSGMLLLHPGWLPRAERPYEGDGQRLVIEFELTAPA